MKKVFLISLFFVVISVFPIFAGEWIQESNGRWWYQNNDGTYPHSGWCRKDKCHYYFDENGYLLTDTVTPDGNTVNSDGVAVEGPMAEQISYAEFTAYTEMVGSTVAQNWQNDHIESRNADSSTELNNVANDEVYIAYYNLMKEKIDAIGCIQPSELETLRGVSILKPDRPGAIFVKLVDFDKNGTDELFLIESVRSEDPWSKDYPSYDLHWLIYSYENGEAVLLANERIYKEYFGLVTDKMGMIHYYEAKGQNSWNDFMYCTLNNGQVSKSDITISWTRNWSFNGTINGQHVSGHSSMSHGNGSGWITVDGNRSFASSNEIKALREEITSGGQEIYDCRSRPADNTVENFIQQIKD